VCVRIHLHVHLPSVYADPDTHSNSYFDAQVATDTKVAPYSAAAPVSYDAVIRVYDEAGNVIETHESA
jgi:hypothetical protein